MSHQNSKGPKAFVHPYGPEKKEPVDTMPSEYQPPGTDETPRAEEEVAEVLLM